MGMLVLAGRDMNVLSSGALSSVPAATTFPWTLAVDGRLGTFGRFGSLTANPLVWIDTDRLRGAGSFDTWSGAVPIGLQGVTFVLVNSGSSTVTQESTIKHSGTSSARFAAAGTGGVASAYVDVVVRAGQRLYFETWLRGDAGTARMKLLIRNIHSGNFWFLRGWRSSSIEVFSHTGTTWSQFAEDLQVESAAACGTLRPTLRFQLLNDVSGTVGYADDFFISPAVSAAAVFGHNIDPRSAPQLRATNDPLFVSSSLVAQPSPARPAFYAAFTRRYERFWGWQFADTNTGSGPIRMAEWIQGDPLELQQPPDFPITRNFEDPQIRGELPYGGQYVAGVGPEGEVLPGLQLSFRQNDAAVQEFLEEVYLRSSGGHPLLIVPDHTRPEVFFGRIPRKWDTKRVQLAIHDGALELESSPLPLLVP